MAGTFFWQGTYLNLKTNRYPHSRLLSLPLRSSRSFVYTSRKERREREKEKEGREERKQVRRN